ncbi:MAG: DUF5063 domain-containing protein [Actinomycetota bacterium]|nr:DUF5063 domain-containing protein [Actinomycetota bacterium]
MNELSTGFDADEFGREIAAAATDFLSALQTISRADDPGWAVPLLLIEVSQILFAGARLGAQQDFTPIQEYQPDVGPDPDLDAMRLRLARLLDSVDTYSYNLDPYSYNLDPYVPEIVASQLSDDLTSIATDLANGLRHFRRGNLAEALWWWQFSYVSTWGGNASAVLRALQSVVAHDRLDLDVTNALEEEQIAAAQAALDGETPRT